MNFLKRKLEFGRRPSFVKKCPAFQKKMVSNFQRSEESKSTFIEEQILSFDVHKPQHY